MKKFETEDKYLLSKNLDFVDVRVYDLLHRKFFLRKRPLIIDSHPDLPIPYYAGELRPHRKAANGETDNGVPPNPFTTMNNHRLELFLPTPSPEYPKSKNMLKNRFF